MVTRLTAMKDLEIARLECPRSNYSIPVEIYSNPNSLFTRFEIVRCDQVGSVDVDAQEIVGALKIRLTLRKDYSNST